MEPCARRIRPYSGALLIPTLLLAGGLAQAASLTAYSSVTPYDIDDQAILGPDESHDLCFSYSGSGAQTQCQDNWSGLDYNAIASSGYGVLKVYGESSTSGLTDQGGLVEMPHYVTTLATAIFRDQWTITGAPAGTTGTLQLTFDVTGSYDYSYANSGIQYGFNMFVFNVGSAARTPSGIPVSGGSGAIDYTQTFTTSFTYGVPLDFQVSLTGGSVMWGLDDGESYFRSSFMDMSNTAIMNAIIVKDGNGDVVPFALTSSSNAPLFNQLIPVVPVPAALPLFLSGVAGLLAVRRRRVA